MNYLIILFLYWVFGSAFRYIGILSTHVHKLKLKIEIIFMDFFYFSLRYPKKYLKFKPASIPEVVIRISVKKVVKKIKRFQFISLFFLPFIY